MSQTWSIRYLWAAVGCGLILFGGSATGAQRIPIQKLDDLPRHTYKITGSVVEFMNDETAIRELAGEVRENIEADLAKYEITDRTTLQGLYADLGSVALIEGNWQRYLDTVDRRIELEDKEAARYTTALVGRAVARARLAGEEDLAARVQEELRRALAGMPYALVEANIKSQKGSAELLSRALVLGSLESSLQPILDGSGGAISQDIASTLLGSHFTLYHFIPLQESIRAVLQAYIDANHVDKPDIWAERDFAIDAGQGQGPVVIAVWDSGVDTAIFAGGGQLWTNAREVPDNGKDDDGNGFVDDVHGIAFSLHSDKETSLLYPIGPMDYDVAQLRSWLKGLTDMRSAVDSEEAAALKRYVSALEQERVKPFLESVNLYGNYAHGTHVAGIAAAGNPYVRLLVARITFDYRLLPEEPTIEQAEKDARALVESIEYFKRNGVRAVNMSWGGSLRSIENALEANNAGGAPEERKVLARRIYEIGDRAFRDAIRNAPEILFITSAGNSDNDVVFEEFYPSSYDYPNILSVGAVDQAGEETSFTSFGKVDVYANGFEVASVVPGGTLLKLSGTSMSSPQVLNLVAKLLALEPQLDTAELRNLIIDGADEKSAGNRKVRLLNPQRSLALLESRQQS